MNIQKSIRIGGLLLLMFGLYISSNAQGRYGNDRHRDEDRWEILGQSHVDGKNDHDRIIVNNRQSYRALQLGIKGGAIEFHRVVVHFDNGADHDLEIRDRIEDRGRTRVIDLPGDRRRIRSVEFWYSKERWRSRPFVNVWGRR